MQDNNINEEDQKEKLNNEDIVSEVITNFEAEELQEKPDSNEILKKLLELKEQGVLTEKEYFDKVNEISNNSKRALKANSKKNKKKLILIMSAVLILLIAIGSGVGYLVNNNNKKEAEERAKYELNFAYTTVSINLQCSLSQILCAEVSDTWSNAIDSDYLDFNTELSDLNQKWNDDGTIIRLKNAKSEIEENMKLLRNPPPDYKEAYNLMVELYGYYTQLYNQAVSPSGSLLTYNQDVNDKTSEYQKAYDKIKVIKPDIEETAKKKEK